MAKEDFQSQYFSSDKSLPIFVNDIGHHRTTPSHSYGPAVRPYYLIHLIESGSGTVIRNGKSVKLKAGDAFVIRPEEVVTYKADNETPWNYYWISFNGSFAGQALSLATTDLYPKFQKSGLIALKNALASKNNNAIVSLSTLFTLLDSVKDENGADEDVITSAINYLNSNYFGQINISSLSKNFGLSRSYFTTQFTLRTGSSPYEYLNGIRIEQAKDYLTSTSLSIKEIAYSVGFSSTERFCNVFKSHTGTTPLNFRKGK